MELEIPGTPILSALAGSHAYGLNTADSDKDYRGVFVARKEDFYNQTYAKEVSDASNDSSYFELGKFADLLSKANPSVLEFLAYPKENILLEHACFKNFKVEDYLTKGCGVSYIGYALGQIRKAYKLKKRIALTEDLEPKSPLDFCYLLDGSDLTPLPQGFGSDGVSVTALDGDRSLFTLWSGGSEGIQFNDQAEIIVGNLGDELLGYVVYDRLAYKRYHKEYDAYHKWQILRKNQPNQDGAYDGKAMMHTARLLYTARDIATQRKLILKRPEQEYLLQIRHQEIPFKKLLPEIEKLIDEVREIFRASDLPDSPNSDQLRKLVFNIRHEIYNAS